MQMITETTQLNRLVQFLQPTEVTVAERFQGPPQMGNGGYTAGRLAEVVDNPTVEVTIRKPIPLERALTIDKLPDQTVLLRDDDTLLVEALPSELELHVPHAPSFAQAIAARPEAAELHDHPFGHCFVCGPQREPGDGLCIFPSWLHGRDLVAAPWIPDASLVDEYGNVKPRFLWAALDCPGAFAVSGQAIRPMVLGRITGTIEKTVAVGEHIVVIGWEIGRDGRKLFAGTALFNQTGQLIGKAKAIWFAL